ncbi:glucosamine-6-phosphate deaminase [Paenibacillus sp. UNC496MF]|uniref:6-phosphogluconolactonase n=1 Tax=Paenibacillus sp. UNC496MF TaxID=1502753 RepID=UPI0008E1EBA1|nr:glucosamine-6-phosphate deaminase [Paenibacillus sp. UNC496MF]SFJ87073.1 glucosamine-6-phosphate deaminase [Paenibacillus sp. UNC496MF]
MTKLIVADDYKAMSEEAANWLAAIVADRPGAAMVLAMGNTPMGMYEALAARRAAGDVDFSAVRAFQLDGYLGLANDDPRSLEGWLRRSVAEPWKLREEQLVLLDENTDDPAATAREYDRRVREAGGFDAAVLGLGPNGHLGFNEPPSRPDSPTRAVALTEKSLQSNAAYWGGLDRVPRESITAGMDVLLGARKVLLLASGAGKREILKRTLEGAVDEGVPSSFLQTHADVTIIADRAAWPEGG